ncbi:MAG: hypothetical protein AB4041_19745 [Microcystaceae cyanobacterium]
MKTLTVAVISSIVLGSLSSPVLAESVAFNPNTNTRQSAYQTQPINLVSIASQGFLEAQGIPSGAFLPYSVKSGKVTAESLVQAAIAQGRLSADTINNRSYLSIVERELKSLDRD